MSRENVEIVRQLYETFPDRLGAMRRGELRMGPPIASDIEWDASETRLPDLGDGVMQGREGVRRFWMAWLAAWEDIRFDYELVDAGDKVVGIIDQQNRGSHIEIPLRYAQVWTFKDGEVVHWKLFLDPDDALEAAGLGP